MIQTVHYGDEVTITNRIRDEEMLNDEKFRQGPTGRVTQEVFQLLKPVTSPPPG